MKKIISLIMAIVTFVASITCLVLFCSVQRIDKQINSQENINQMVAIKKANEEFMKIAENLVTLYDLDDVTRTTLREIQDSSSQLLRLESLADEITKSLPITVPLGDTDINTITETSHNQIANDLVNWQKDTINNIQKILDYGDSAFKKIGIQSKEYCDSDYRDKINLTDTLKGTYETGLMKIPENMMKMQRASAYLISCIGYAIIACVSLLIYILCKKGNVKLFVIIDLIVVVVFSIFTVLNLLGIFADKSKEQHIPETNANWADGNNNNYTNNTTPISEWGFNNLNELGYGLVQITDYDLEEGYVCYAGDYEGNIFKLENGYYIVQKHLVEKGSLIATYTTQYEVVNNDSFLLPGDGTFVVSERKQIGDDFIILVNENGGALTQNYVPYSLIDWDKGIHPADNGEEFKYSYKLYLK